MSDREVTLEAAVELIGQLSAEVGQLKAELQYTQTALDKVSQVINLTVAKDVDWTMSYNVHLTRPVGPAYTGIWTTGGETGTSFDLVVTGSDKDGKPAPVELEPTLRGAILQAAIKANAPAGETFYITATNSPVARQVPEQTTPVPVAAAEPVGEDEFALAPHSHVVDEILDAEVVQLYDEVQGA